MRKLLSNENGVVQYLVGAIAGLIAIIIGVLIWYKTNLAIGAGTAPTAAYGATYASVNTTANSIWTLFPIVAIVVIAAIILMVIMAFGGQRQA